MESKSIGISADFSLIISTNNQRQLKTPWNDQSNLNSSETSKVEKKNRSELWSKLSCNIGNDFNFPVPNAGCSPKVHPSLDCSSPQSRLRKSLDAGRETLVLLKDFDDIAEECTSNVTRTQEEEYSTAKSYDPNILETPHNITCELRQSKRSLLLNSPIALKSPLNASTPVAPNSTRKRIYNQSDDADIQIIYSVIAPTRTKELNDSMDDPEFNLLLSHACANATVKPVNDNKDSADDVIIIDDLPALVDKSTKNKSILSSGLETPKLRRYSDDKQGSHNSRFRRRLSLFQESNGVSPQKLADSREAETKNHLKSSTKQFSHQQPLYHSTSKKKTVEEIRLKNKENILNQNIGNYQQKLSSTSTTVTRKGDYLKVKTTKTSSTCCKNGDVQQTPLLNQFNNRKT